MLDEGDTPFNFPNLKFSLDTQESMDLNNDDSSHVIMAGAGMCNAGRIKHHLKHNLWKSNTHVVIVGYQAQGSTGRKLVDGASSVRIFREEVAVKAKVHTIGGFSAHADSAELLEWLELLVHPGLQVFLTHGEESGTREFMKAAKRRYTAASFYVPEWQEALTIEPGLERPLPAAAPVPKVARAEDSLGISARLASLSQELMALAAKAAQGQASHAEMQRWLKGLDQAEKLFTD